MSTGAECSAGDLLTMNTFSSFNNGQHNLTRAEEMKRSQRRRPDNDNTEEEQLLHVSLQKPRSHSDHANEEWKCLCYQDERGSCRSTDTLSDSSDVTRRGGSDRETVHSLANDVRSPVNESTVSHHR